MVFLFKGVLLHYPLIKWCFLFIGHALALRDFPLAMQEVRARQIGIELCPISNQMLEYVADIRYVIDCLHQLNSTHAQSTHSVQAYAFLHILTHSHTFIRTHTRTHSYTHTLAHIHAYTLHKGRHM